MNARFFFLILILFSLLISCNSDRLKIDVSGVTLDLTVQRLDKAMIPIQTGKEIDQLQSIEDDFGQFGEIYLNYILKAGGTKNDSALVHLSSDPIYPLILNVQEGINVIESDIASQTELIKDGFKHFAFYFPEATIPDVVFMNSWFQYGVFTTDNTLAIGLDFFLPDTTLQNQYPPQFYNYLRADMKPEFIASNGMYGWLTNIHFPPTGDENTLIEKLIYKGKVRYLLEAMFPELPETVIMNYSEEELEWCYKKQLATWLHLTELTKTNKARIFEDNKVEINKWVSPGPFTAALSEKSTDRMGEWMGLQMVRDFMKENPEVSVPEMLQKNSREIMKFYNAKK